jgi:hypothetical protein
VTFNRQALAEQNASLAVQDVYIFTSARDASMTGPVTNSDYFVLLTASRATWFAAFFKTE